MPIKNRKTPLKDTTMNNEYGLMAVESGEMLALRGVEVAARVSGILAETSLTQKYKNDGETNLELTYTFPLPVAGTLLSFSVAIGERKFLGEVIARAQAELEYEKAIGEGNSAFRLQEIRPGMYNATLGNVMAGESVEISLNYAETLAWNGKSIRYRLPTTIAPRFGDPTGMQPWQKPSTNISAEYPLSLKVAITGALAQGAISCPSHKISMKSGQGELSIILANGASMDRDFILEIQNDQVQSLGAAAFARETHIAMLTLLPPELDSIEKQRDVVLVLDCSGSMMGDSIKLAKEGVLLALGSLQPNERFGIIGFGTRFLQFDKSLQPANRKNLDMARRWVSHLDDLGGTDINGALELALTQHDGNAMDILLLTDGQDWQAGKSVPAAKANGVRIFTMGIGSAVAEESIRMMADETGGACELIAPTEDMSERIYRHFNRMRQPQMRNLNIAWSCEPIWESRPDRACFAGDAYTVFAALPEASTNTVTVSFEFEGHGTQAIEVPLSVETEASDAIIRIAAKHRLAAMPAEAKQAWAVYFQLLTDETDYLITVERSADEKATELPELQVQPQMLPAGWGGTSSVVVQACVSSVQAYASPVFSRSNVCFSQSVDYSHLDVPACLRKRSSPSVADFDNGYEQFIKLLKSRANRKLLAGLPKTLSGLKGIPLPEQLADLLEMLRDSHPEEEIVLAFYQALLEHDGKGQFDSKFQQKAEGIISSRSPNFEIVEEIVKCLNKLRNDQGFLSSEGRYEIPAFLRKQAD